MELKTILKAKSKFTAIFIRFTDFSGLKFKNCFNDVNKHLFCVHYAHLLNPFCQAGQNGLS